MISWMVLSTLASLVLGSLAILFLWYETPRDWYDRFAIRGAIVILAAAELFLLVITVLCVRAAW